MHPITRSTHASRLERWLGKETVEGLSLAMKDWYGPPIAVHNVPGNVWAHKGGDFKGVISSGQYMNVMDFAMCRLKRAFRDSAQRAILQHSTGFASLTDLISEAVAGKTRIFPFNKQGVTVAVVAPVSYWGRANFPPAGSAPGNAAAGTAFDSTASGTFQGWQNPSGGDQQYFLSGQASAGVSGGSLLLYDLLFGCNKTMASVANEAVTGVPTRYQSITSTDQNFAGGNFLFIQVGGTLLPNTAHNWTSCTYLDQGGNASTLPDVTGVPQQSIHTYDMNPGHSFFCPLASGDYGVQALTSMQCSASVATGVIWFMIGHPIAWMPCPLANYVSMHDGIATSFNFARIFDNACLAFLSMVTSSTAASYTGSFTTVSG